MKNKFILIFVAPFIPFTLSAQPPKSSDLLETGIKQRRELSIPGSRLLINPFDFSKPIPTTESDYSDRNTLPLNLAWLSTTRGGTDRFDRQLKNFITLYDINGKPANSISTNWTPHKVSFNASFINGDNLTGYDFMYDKNTLIRNIHFSTNNSGAYSIIGTIPNEFLHDSKNNIIIFHSANYSLSIKFSSVLNLQFYDNLNKALANYNPLNTPSNTSRIWRATFNAADFITKPLSMAVSFRRIDETDDILLQRVESPFISTNIADSLAQREEFWDNFLSKVPEPLNYTIEKVPNKGLSSNDVKLAYYKAWVLIANCVLDPDPVNYPYYQVVTGKASLWDEGHPKAPFSASWESFISMQQYAFVDPQVAWSAFKGFMSLVDADGMITGEGLPTRKAETAYLLYQFTGDKISLAEVYPALSRNIQWSVKYPMWIYKNTPNNTEKDYEFVVSALVDLKYMREIAVILGKKNEANMLWESLRQNYFNDFLSFFWKSGSNYPYQYHVVGASIYNSGFNSVISTGLYLDFWKDNTYSNYYQGILNRFNSSYDLSKPFAGIDNPKCPNIDYSIYGLLQYKKLQEAANVTEAAIRDIIISGPFFAESYSTADPVLPEGVRPSTFGASALIKTLLLKNGFFYDAGIFQVARLFESSIGVKGININNKLINFNIDENGISGFSGDALNAYTDNLIVGDVKPINYKVPTKITNVIADIKDLWFNSQDKTINFTSDNNAGCMYWFVSVKGQISCSGSFTSNIGKNIIHLTKKLEERQPYILMLKNGNKYFTKKIIY